MLIMTSLLARGLLRHPAHTVAQETCLTEADAISRASQSLPQDDLALENKRGARSLRFQGFGAQGALGVGDAARARRDGPSPPAGDSRASREGRSDWALLGGLSEAGGSRHVALAAQRRVWA